VALATLLAGMIGLGLFLLRHGGPRMATPAPSAGIVARVYDRAAGGPPRTVPTAGPLGPLGPLPGDGQRFAVDASLLAGLREGDCLTWTPDPAHEVVPVRVSCDQPHIDQIIQIVDLSGGFPGWLVWPGSAGLTTATLTHCPDAVRGLSGTTVMAPDLLVASIYPEKPAWLAGVYGLICTLRTGDLRTRLGPAQAVGVPT
jgi:hypothetical protein